MDQPSISRPQRRDRGAGIATILCKHQPLLWSVLALLLLFAGPAACSGDDALLANRPQATSTPAAPHESGAGGSAHAAPVPMPPAAPTPTPLPTDLLATLPTAEQLALTIVPTRDLRDLALRLEPEVADIPEVVNETAPDYQVGDIIDFQVHDLGANRNFSIRAELVHKTDVAYAWVEEGQKADVKAIAAAIDHFSTVSYPAVRGALGSEWSPGVDNDPRLHVLHATGIGSGVAGYYSSADQFSRLANEFSNEKEMFYINLAWLNSARDYDYYETVLAHEFQHMIHWRQDRNEETWLNEGLSEYAQEIAGFPPDTTFANSFAQQPDTQLNTWNDSSQGNAEHYGSAYLLVAYLAQRFGPDFLAALVSHPANGIAGIDAVLGESGLDLTFDDIFADWLVANYVDDPNALGLDGLYGYREVAPNPPALAGRYNRPPADPIQADVANFGADYWLLEEGEDIQVRFQGQTKTGLTATRAYSGDLAWWSNRGDDSNPRLTRRFDFSQVAPDAPLALEATMWWDIEVDYDYGYALVSRDGRTWSILETERTTRANPSGNSFGPAYTGKSSPDEEGNATWVTERYDLRDYAGEEIWFRFEYVTDDAVNASGWLIDDIRVPALDYATDFEDGPAGWESEGWLLSDGAMEQAWLVQILEFDRDRLVGVTQAPVNGAGEALLDLGDLGDGRSAAIAVSGMTPVTTERAEYSLTFE